MTKSVKVQISIEFRKYFYVFLFGVDLLHMKTSAEDNQGSGCTVDRPFREAIDKFHNGLRQRIAKGETEGYGPAREMYGLVYDCGLEEEARKEAKLTGDADLHHRRVTRFFGLALSQIL
ncbi:hypothetical protein ANCCAN_12985 [Ancylostoma caninum]|uniref:SCP domain-containing protein n=1 Tax=Ancylostoma caninum TaxID=29170 RepID=A0A368GCU4_ANCCA|nr:hypothetical protein ANCCAN_12985 [Ancylostoma caninum]